MPCCEDENLCQKRADALQQRVLWQEKKTADDGLDSPWLDQIEGKAIDGRTDMYALGITAFELFTGQHPFSGEDKTNMIDVHLYEDVPNPKTLVPDLPNELDNFVVRATRRDLSARYGSVSEALRDLEPLAKTVTPSHVLQ